MSNWGVVPRIGPGLCATCGHVDTVRSNRGSVFLRCRLSDVDPHFPKYPTLPVVECIGWASGSDNQPAEHRSNEPRVAEYGLAPGRPEFRLFSDRRRHPARSENQLPSPVPVRFRHPELADRLALEVEFDQHCSFITNDPPIVTGLDDDNLRSRELDSAAVRILNVDLAAGQEPDVRVHAEIGTDDRFHVFGPAKSRRVDDAFHSTGAGSNNINLGAADLAAFAAGDGREKWII